MNNVYESLGATWLSGSAFLFRKILKWSDFYINDIYKFGKKILLNIKEASDLFGIGQHRLCEIVKEDYESKL